VEIAGGQQSHAGGSAAPVEVAAPPPK
jgi:hypothetical protein